LPYISYTQGINKVLVKPRTTLSSFLFSLSLVTSGYSWADYCWIATHSSKE